MAEGVAAGLFDSPLLFGAAPAAGSEPGILHRIVQPPLGPIVRKSDGRWKWLDALYQSGIRVKTFLPEACSGKKANSCR